MRILSEAADRLIPYWEMLVAITHHLPKILTSSFMLSLVHLQYDFLVSGHLLCYLDFTFFPFGTSTFFGSGGGFIARFTFRLKLVRISGSS